MDVVASSLLDLTAQLYHVVLRRQRGLTDALEEREGFRMRREDLIARIQRLCKELTSQVAAASSSHEEESGGEQLRRLDIISNVAGLCLYAHGLLLYSNSSDGSSLAAVAQSQRDQARTKLNESVKKNPGQLESWLLLSHILWERGDISGAIRTIITGLSFTSGQGVNKVEERKDKEAGSYENGPSPPLDLAHRVALQQLSMLVRQRREASPELLQLSLDLASRAVRGDVTDGHSWYCLGLAQLSSYLHLHTPLSLQGGEGSERFGTASRRARLLKNTLASFSQAEGNGLSGLADLYFNRAQIRTYQQEFQLAILDYERAAVRDRALPTSAQIDALVGLLRQTTVLLNTRGGVNEKDWSRIVGLLREDEIKVRRFVNTLLIDCCSPSFLRASAGPSGGTEAGSQ